MATILAAAGLMLGCNSADQTANEPDGKTGRTLARSAIIVGPNAGAEGPSFPLVTQGRAETLALVTCQADGDACKFAGDCCSGACREGACSSRALEIVAPPETFAPVPQGSPSPPIKYTITNPASAESGLLAVSSASSEFEVLSDGCTGKRLPPGGSCTVEVRFTPAGPGERQGTMKVANDGVEANLLALQGTSLQPPGLRPLALVPQSPPGTSFGPVNVGQTSQPLLFSLQNLGAAPATVVFALGSPDFVLVSNGCLGPLPVGGTCNLQVVFRPGQPGPSHGILQASSTDGLATTIALSGTGLGEGLIAFGEETMEFTSQPVGQTSTATTLFLYNQSKSATGALTVSLTGANPGDFVITQNGCPTSLPPGARCPLRLVFKPTMNGDRAATINASSAGGGVASAIMLGRAQGEKGTHRPPPPPRQPNLPGGVGVVAGSDPSGLVLAVFPPGGGGTAQPSVEEVYRRHIAPVLTTTGFSSPQTITFPLRAQTLPGGSYDRLLKASCHGVAAETRASSLCQSLLPPPILLQTTLPKAFIRQVEPQVHAQVEQMLGMSLARLQEEVDQPLEYWFFTQRYRGIPIEHRGLVAVRKGDRKVSTVFGSMVNRIQIDNRRTLDGAEALARAARYLPDYAGPSDGGPKRWHRRHRGREHRRHDRCDDEEPTPTPATKAELVLLPVDNPSRHPGKQPPAPLLRYAYRGRVMVAIRGAAAARGFTLWADADNGRLLKHTPDEMEGEPAPLETPILCRDPGEVPEGQAFLDCKTEFQAVADATTETFRLENQAFSRLQVPAGTAQLEIGFLDVPPYYQHESTVCRDDGSAFRQRNAFGHLNMAYDKLTAGGSFPSWDKPIGVAIDDPLETRNFANINDLTITFRATANMCPLFAPQPHPTITDKVFGGAQDGTIVAHEMAHLATMQLQRVSPAPDCTQASCPVRNPVNRFFYHDYSDGYAALLARTPCIGGWASRGGSPTVAEACLKGGPAGSLPRLLMPEARSSVPLENIFVDAPPGPVTTVSLSHLNADVFPDHRNSPGPGEYPDGEMVGAGIWQAQQGMLSQASVLGSLPVWGRLNRAVWSSGFAEPFCPQVNRSCSRNLYRSTQEVLWNLVDGWVSSEGSYSQNKVLSAFARVGFFLVPDVCLDGLAATRDAWYCPDFDMAGDAVVDIFDGNHTDGEVHVGVRQVENDFVAHGDPSNPGPPPSFRIWTGPAFRFTGNSQLNTAKWPINAAGNTGEGACNDSFEVEYFVEGYSSDWKPAVAAEEGTVDRKCYVTRDFEAAAWAEVRGHAQDFFANNPGTSLSLKVQYRLTTWRKANRNATFRDSNRPGAGQWDQARTILPSAFFVNQDGVGK